MFSWDDLRVFLAVHRNGSHAAAARVLNVDATTVSRRVMALESAVGARLFTRSPSALLPTPAGQSLFEHAERVEAEIIALTRKLCGITDSVAGTVRMTAPDGLTTYRLVPGLLTLRRAYPSLKIELLGDNELLDLGRREADIAVRLGRPAEKYLVVKRVGLQEMGVFGGRSYFSERQRPTRPEDLRDHDWIAHESRWDQTPESRWFQQYVSSERLVLRTRTTTAVLSACASGHGLTVLPVAFTEGDARLVRVLADAQVPVRELWAITHEDLRHSPPVTATMRWLEVVLSSDRRPTGQEDQRATLPVT
jgi:DNA-binding transcriptional LysR family regulator